MGLTEYLNLAKAFRRVDSDRRDDAWPDIVGYRDYKRNEVENFKTLQGKIQTQDRYKAELPLTIDLPKRGFTLRPGIVPFIDDRIAYQAIADLFTPHFSPEPNVYSNKLAGLHTDQMFVKGVELWIAFQNKVEEHCHNYPYMVETDIAAYFDHINHELLLSRISDLFGKAIDKEILDGAKAILRRMWGRWNVGYPTHFGIPQMNDASSFMANLYLDELDKWLLARRIVCVRYVDDIRIFAESEPGARKLLAQLIVKMREMGLYIASGKTKIKPTKDVLGELAKGRSQIKEIEADIDSANPDRMNAAARKMGDFFMQLVSDSHEFDDRLFRFCVNRFQKLYVTGLGVEICDTVIHEVLQRLSSMPESTDTFVDYLSLFTDNEYLQTFIMEFLEGPYNIYPWQEMQLLELLVRVNLTPDMRQRANQYANALIVKGGHPACKSRAYVLRGKNGTYADRRDIRSHYPHEDREDLRRSIIVALQDMKAGERNNFYRGIATDSRGIGQAVDYIQALREPTYHYYKRPSPYDVFPPDDDSDDIYDLGSEYFV